ncbi:MAG TPA: helix-turn-helix domain-containing protein, partial [Gammaproteobacteria bacterium]|nr:helix-turn-helix domain-containing protein [Gammaproteobacteria bacterium]
DWPGNVRELKNAVERSVYRNLKRDRQIVEIAFDPFDSPYRLRSEAKREKPQRRQAAGANSPLLPTDLSARVSELEIGLLQAGLERARYNQRVAADLLGLTYHQFRGKIRKHGLDTQQPEAADS